MEESPRRCHECFPEITPQTFFLRKRFIQSHLSLVDLFLAPSRFLRDRYVDWGIPAERIVVEEYGRTPPPAIPASRRCAEHRDRFGFFGQLTPFKGVHVLLEAMADPARPRAADDPLIARARSSLSARRRAVPPGPRAAPRRSTARTSTSSPAPSRTSPDLLEATRENVTFVGRYDHDEARELMAEVDWVVVPSIWWENSPLVIQEAFHRPAGDLQRHRRDGGEGRGRGQRPALPGRRSDEPRRDDAKAAAGTGALGSPPRRHQTHVFDGQHVAVLSGLYAELLAEKRAAHAG